MKQLIIRSFPNMATVFGVEFGAIVDGSFKPQDLCCLPDSIASHIVVDDLLGSSAYIRQADITGLIKDVMPILDLFEVYPGFFVLTLNIESYVSKAENEEE